MALVQDELVLKVRAETSGLAKEFKKLRKALSNAFNTKKNSKDFKKLEDELRDMRRMATFDPFKSWNSSLTDAEKKLKRVGAQTLKQNIKSMKGLVRQWSRMTFDGFDGSDWQSEMVEEYEKELERLNNLRKQGYKYDIKPDAATENYMRSKYKTERILEYAEYINTLKKTKQAEEDLAEFEKKNPAFNKEDYQAKVAHLKERLQAPWAKKEEASGKKSTVYTSFEAEIERLEKLIAEYEEINSKLDELRSKYSDDDVADFKSMESDAEKYKKTAEKAAKEQEELEEKGEKKRRSRIGTFFRKVFKTFFGQLLGAALVRRLINNIFNQIKQGTQNLYEWSRYNKQEWADIFDKSKSSQVALGNAMAVTWNYVTILFKKLFTTIRDGLVQFFNWISRGLAQLLGESTAVQASKDIMSRWSDNVSATRQLIQGFDKLNIWQGNDNTLPKDMFYEIQVGKKKAKEIGQTMGEEFINYVLSSDPTYIGGAGAQTVEEKEENSFWKNIKDFFVGIWEGLKLGWVKVKEWFNGILLKIKTWWNGVTTEDEGENGEIITRQVEPGFKHALKEWFDTKVKGWWSGTVVPFFENLWNEKLKPWFVGAWEKIKKWFDESIEPFMTKLADTLAKWWQNRKQTTNYQIEDWVYDKTGAVIDIEDTLRQFKRLMPWNWGKDLSEEVSFNAAGGVYTSPALGLVGEASTRNNPELVTPTALLDDRLQANNRELLSAFNGMMNGVISAVNGISMEVKIGDDVIARSASRGNEQYYKQMGRPLIR